MMVNFWNNRDWSWLIWNDLFYTQDGGEKNSCHLWNISILRGAFFWLVKKNCKIIVLIISNSDRKKFAINTTKNRIREYNGRIGCRPHAALIMTTNISESISKKLFDRDRGRSKGGQRGLKSQSDSNVSLFIFNLFEFSIGIRHIHFILPYDILAHYHILRPCQKNSSFRPLSVKKYLGEQYLLQTNNFYGRIYLPTSCGFFCFKSAFCRLILTLFLHNSCNHNCIVNILSPLISSLG